jgi:hypothetical protein
LLVNVQVICSAMLAVNSSPAGVTGSPPDSQDRLSSWYPARPPLSDRQQVSPGKLAGL